MGVQGVGATHVSPKNKIKIFFSKLLPKIRWKSDAPWVFMINIKFCHLFRFFTTWRIWRHGDVKRKFIVLILIDMDRGNQDLNIGTKYIYNFYIFIFSVFHDIITHCVSLLFLFIVHIIIMLSVEALKDLSQFQWKSAHAPKKELPKDFLWPNLTKITQCLYLTPFLIYLKEVSFNFEWNGRNFNKLIKSSVKTEGWIVFK